MSDIITQIDEDTLHVTSEVITPYSKKELKRQKQAHKDQIDRIDALLARFQP